MQPLCARKTVLRPGRRAELAGRVSPEATDMMNTPRIRWNGRSKCAVDLCHQILTGGDRNAPTYQ